MKTAICAILLGAAALASAQAYAAGRAADVAAHWTAERRAAATPRDLVIDDRGLGYLRLPDGHLAPYGHSIAAQHIETRVKPPADDPNPASITGMDPDGSTPIGSSYTFSADVTDPDGIRSVSFVVEYPDGATTQPFTPGSADGHTWTITLNGFTDGGWSWWVVVKDLARFTTTSAPVDFTVGGGEPPPDPGDIVADAEWTYGGAVQWSAGRLYFEMPANKTLKRWNGYVCSGTVATDGTLERSVIITASHCVYDDANKAFARNVLFIPDQAETEGDGTDLDCNNDPFGCWVPSFGVVDVNWTTRTFPDNVAWDYAYYVVSDTGAHQGVNGEEGLEDTTGGMTVSFDAPYVDDGVPGADSDDFTYALGYSYSWDPMFRYSAEDMTTMGDANWWLPSSELSGGSSGGPWVQPMDTIAGNGPIISVNSWGYTTSPGMAGPKLSGTSAQCVFEAAIAADFSEVPTTDGNAGVVETCP